MRNNFTIVIIVFLSVFLYKNIACAATNHVKNDQAEVTLLGGGYSEGKAQAGLNFKLEQGWHVYWHLAGDTGFPPTLDWKDSTNVKNIDVKWPAPTRDRQEIQPGNTLESYVYKDEVTLPITIMASDASKPLDLSVSVSYAICAETCIPGNAELELSLQPNDKYSDNLDKIASALKLVPQENGTNGLKIESVNKAIDDSGKAIITVKASNIHDFDDDATIFIDGGEHFLFQNPIAKISGESAQFNVSATPTSAKKDLSDTKLTITLKNGKNAVEQTINSDAINASIETPVTIQNTGTSTILTMLFFAFLGGLILNVMPCVLPILSIKLLGLIKHGGGHKNEVTTSFLVTSLGILTSFFAFAIITIWLKEAGSVVGWGLHFQQPYFIIALVVILTLFAANMWGLYEININWSEIFKFNKPKLAKKSKKVKSPPQSSKALDSKVSHFMSGMLATVLATPCTAPFLGVAIGFAVTRGAFEIITIFLAMGLGLAFPYLLFSFCPGLITKLPKPGKWMVTIKKFMGSLLAVSAIWLIWVLSNQLGGLAALVLLILCILKILKLWAANHYDFIQKIKIPLIIFTIFLAFTIPIRVANNVGSPAEGARDMWEEFHPEHIAGLVANGKIVFVDVTADWCLTCKVNKLAVLERTEMKEAFSKLDVVAMQANWTNRDEKIAHYLMDHKRAGIPFNIVYGPGAPDGIILSELLSTKDVLAALKKAGEK